MKRISLTFICTSFSFTVCTVFLFFSQTIIASEQPHNNHSKLGFTENKGQVVNQHFIPNTQVKYILHSPGLNVQLKKNSFSYDTYTAEVKGTDAPAEGTDPKQNRKGGEITYTNHRIDIEFINANPQPEIIAENPSMHYYNYYTTGTPQLGITQVRQFSKVTYKNLYPKIDLEFITNETGVKYNFILHPGGNASHIKWIYKGSNNTQLKNEKIQIDVIHGEMFENIPESFIAENKQPISVSFTQQKSTFGFNVPNYDQSKTLVIDPNPSLYWSTYFGGSAYDWSNNINRDKNGQIYMVGYTGSNANIATNGTHQTTYGGGIYDAFVAKFDTLNGTLLWATYYGGANLDYGYGITTDNSGYIYFTGETNSTTAISTPSSHQPALNGSNYDAFLVKLTPNGTRVWGTYYGGSVYDYGNDVAVDNNANVFLCGYTSSTNAGTISTPSSHQQSFGGGYYDGFLAKFDSSGVRQWGTYYGGNAEDRSRGLATDKFGNVYMGGYTASNSAISTGGSHQPVYGGGLFDAFLVKFNASGTRQWGTYFGANNADYGFGLTVEPSLGNIVYISGYTQSTSGITSAGVHQPIYGGGPFDGYVARFTSAGVRKWSTYYGGNSNDFVYGIAIDPSGKGDVFICGQTESTMGIATNLAFKDTVSGFNDAYVARIDTTCYRLWGTYYGGVNQDIAHAVAVDTNNNVYISGITNSTNNIATPGVHQTTFGGGQYDAFLTRFENCPSFSTAGSNAPLCMGQTLQLTSSGGVTYSWSGPNGFTSTQQNPSIPNVTFVNTGTYTVIVTNQAGCISVSFVNVAISAPSAFAISNSPVCETQTLILSGFGGTIYNWTGPNGFSSSQQNANIPNVTMAAAGTYTLMVEDAYGCKDTTTTNVIVQSCVGVNEFDKNAQIGVFPNPNNGSFSIQFNNADAGTYFFKIYNIVGEIIYSSRKQISGNTTLELSIPNVETGVYFIEISKENAFYSIEKMIVH
ncbi:hypothetical protein FLAV_00618 [Flavobacteriales bacterium]|nr:hypothetical protein [Flavobacteriales bacterium]MCL4815413.1 SBBP repeat-containing protein [Flavobacteriales bacterium]WKZ75032.1 MAG: SBBP repeat-containing protein [Vicingaceae bacterium]GIK69974.1 MAG: hypothetical protein BroJett020_12690 [Bacteroidota bacterium]CAG0959442.1 hypothetical protein FLAV_00618 [Flavobacteriales bacterium]